MSVADAKETYEDLIFNYTEVDDAAAFSMVDEFDFNLRDAEEITIKIRELPEYFKNLFMTHIETYGEDCIIGDKVIVIACDWKSGNHLVLDRNHRINTFRLSDPNKLFKVKVIHCSLPTEILAYPFS